MSIRVAGHRSRHTETTPVGPVTVGVDGSRSSLEAARWAASEAALQGSALAVVAVRTWTTGPPTAAADALAAVRAEMPDLPVGGRVRWGDPVEVLLEESARSRLLVVGNRGLGTLRGLVIGSVSGPVAARAHCPVVVVRGPEHVRDGHPVVLGVDGTSAGEAAIGWAFEAADRRGVGLVAVHVWRDRLDDPEWASPFEPEDPVGSERELLAERLAGWGGHYPDVTLTQVLEEEDPVRALIAHSLQAQLLVVGSRGRSGPIGRWTSVSTAVIHEAQCPVAVVRTEVGAAPAL